MPSGNISPGGTKIQARAVGIGNWQPVLATVGTTGGGANTAMALACRYSSIWIPGDCLITGVKYLAGLTVGTNKAIGVLFDEGGSVLAYSAVAGTITSGASTFQTLAFTVPYQAQGPGLFFIGICFDGATDTYSTVPANCHLGILGGTSAQGTFPVSAATINALTISATAFTNAQAPVVQLY